MPTNQDKFLTRRTLGQPNYLLIAVAAAFLIALTPRGAYKAVQGNSNSLDSQLSAASDEIVDLDWFREQFDGDQFVLVSWEGCTLAEAGKLQRVARRLAREGNLGGPRGAEPLFTRVTTGPDVLDQLMGPPYSLPYEVAVSRLEGAVIGAPRDAASGEGDQAARSTCLAAYLSPFASENETVRRQAVDRIREVVASEAHIDPASIRMVGPGIDAIAIDDESQQTLVWLGSLAVAVGFGVAWWRLHSMRLAAAVIAVGVVSAVATLAIIFYFGVFEVLSLHRVAPLLGRADALALAATAVVYVLAVSAAVRLIHYYRDARLNDVRDDAAERAVADGRPYWSIGALIIAAAFGVLSLSELLPARKFGLFAGLGLLASVAAVVTIVPVMLHRFPPSNKTIAYLGGDRRRMGTPRWLAGMFELAAASPTAVLILASVALGIAGWGLTKLDAAPRLPAMASKRSQLWQDYAWFDRHVGNAVPMEVVLTVPIERCREPSEPAEADGQQYRLTLEERMRLMRDMEDQLAGGPEISTVLSPATAMPAAETLADNGAAVREALERHGYVRVERHRGSDQPTGRELWRMSARVAASMSGQGDVDYARVAHRVRAEVNTVLQAYQQRDWLVRALHQQGKQLAGSKVAILFRAPEDRAQPIEGSPERLLAELLPQSGVAEGDVTLVNLTLLEQTGRAGDSLWERTLNSLTQVDATVLASGELDAQIEQMRSQGVKLVDLRELPTVEESRADPPVLAGGPRPIRAVFTGMPPVATAVNEELWATLRESVIWVVPALAIVLMFVAWDVVGGVLALAPALLPTVAVLGALGWAGVNMDAGVLVLAGLSMAIALDGTVNFLVWMRRGADAGLFRGEAARLAYGRVGRAMLDTTLIAGVGMLALGLSGIVFAQQFGLLAIAILGSSMIGTLVVLPAIAASPLGRFYGAEAASPISDATITPATEAPAPGRREPRTGRADVAAASGPAAPHRTRPAAADEERHEAADAPHSALHAKLRRLRRRAGDSPTS